MRRKKMLMLSLVILVTLTITLNGCAQKTEGTDHAENVAIGETAALVQNNTGSDEADTDMKDEEAMSAETIPEVNAISIPEGTQNLVGIIAQIKEIYEDGSMVIESQNSEFEGTYYVLKDEDTLMTEVAQDDFVEVLMLAVNSTESPGICGVELAGQEKQQYMIYLAKEIIRIEVQDEYATEDILLTYAPEIAVSDMLSSTMNSVELQAGNCNWSYPENGMMTSIIACGAHPLDEAVIERISAWKLPEYQKMDHVPVSFSCKPGPDKLVIREWGMEAAGDYEAEPLSVTVYYYPVTMLKIKPDRIYEFSAAWNEESGRNYYGEGSYMLVTD